MTPFAVLVMVALPGLWMLGGALDNWLHADLNRNIVRQVMRLERMEQDYPQDFAHVAHRRIENPALINLCFRLIVVWETLAALLLCTGAIGLAYAGLTGTDTATARTVALLGALVFTTNWAGFLIGGNCFHYYYCHFEGQVTHFLLTLWGCIVTTVLVLVP